MLPVIFDLKGEKCLVFGGGKVAERRIKKLLQSGAIVKAVSENFSPTLKSMTIERVEKTISPPEVGGYLEGFNLIFALTSSRELNERIEREARKRCKLVNRGDSASDLIFPAFIEEGDLIISVSTRGKAPAATRLIKEKIKNSLTQKDILLIKLNKFLRGELKSRIPSAERRQDLIWEIVNRKGIAARLDRGDLEGAKKLALDILEDSDAYS